MPKILNAISKERKYQAKSYAMWSLWSQVPKSRTLLLFSLEALQSQANTHEPQKRRLKAVYTKILILLLLALLPSDGRKIQPSELFAKIMRSRSEPRSGRAKGIYLHSIQNEATLQKAAIKGIQRSGACWREGIHDNSSISHGHMEDTGLPDVWWNTWANTELTRKGGLFGLIVSGVTWLCGKTQTASQW